MPAMPAMPSNIIPYTQAGQSTKVVALGGSITAGMGVRRQENSYVEVRV